MLTMITGTPGAGKSLYTVWEIARKIPGTTIEVGGEVKPRRLLSNIKNLCLEHELIGADQLNTWHEWAKPGDVIVFDEVQEVWRPRGMGSKIPPCIAALETHRHMGVDIVLITQHPLLCDPNIRRLINQHLHLRRVTKRLAMVYEWDHCSNISSMKSAIQSKLWRHPQAGYRLYRSAQAHTKPTQRMPRFMWFGVLALAAAAFAIPNAIGRLQNSFGMGDKLPIAAASKPAATAVPLSNTVIERRGYSDPSRRTVPVQSDPSRHTVGGGFDPSPRTVVAGCIITAARACECFTSSGKRADNDQAMCTALTDRPVHQLADIAGVVVPALPLSASELDLIRFVARNRSPIPESLF